jgi:hypothetical protein
MTLDEGQLRSVTPIVPRPRSRPPTLHGRNGAGRATDSAQNAYSCACSRVRFLAGPDDVQVAARGEYPGFRPVH